MVYLNNFLNKAAATNQSRAMEVDTISKNGRSLKSQMSKVNILKLALALFVVTFFCVGFSSCSESEAQNSNNSSASTRWEYKVINHDKNAENVLNDLGKEGWELVSVAPWGGSVQNNFIYAFKRRPQ